MNLKQHPISCCGTLLIAMLLLVSLVDARAQSASIHILEVSGSINPGVADYLQKGLKKASDEGALCTIVTLDTPGGLAESMRRIVMAIFASKIPVVVYVSPSGARAASAGVMITVAADIAAMAPGTNIGAAHPVGVGGQDIGDAMSDKVTNDMAAYAKSIAEKRKRNVVWVEKAVRESVAVTETEALKENIIDIIAEDMDDLIGQLEGRTVEGKGLLKLKGAGRKVIPEGLRTKILKTISDPNIAYILLMIGLAGLYFELSHPGTIFPGVIGGIALVLAFFALQALPVNYAGVLLIALAIVFFIMEMKITSYGLLSVAGVVSLLLGSLMLFEGEGPGAQLSWSVLVPTMAVISGFFILIAGLVFRSQVSTARTGVGGLIGEIGIVKRSIDPRGKVFVHGELWYATANSPLPEGTRVQVVRVQGLELEVAPVDDPGAEQNAS